MPHMRAVVPMQRRTHAERLGESWKRLARIGGIYTTERISASSATGAKILSVVSKEHVPDDGGLNSVRKMVWAVTANLPLGVIQMAEGASRVMTWGLFDPGWTHRFVTWRMERDALQKQREIRDKRDRGCTG